MRVKHDHSIGFFTADVNGVITDGKNKGDRSEYRSMLKDILKRIEDRLKVVGLDATSASRRAQLSADAIRNIRRSVSSEKKDAGVNSHTLIQLAPVLETTASWLLEGSDHGVKDLPPSSHRLWSTFAALESAPPQIQDRVIAFAEYQLAAHANSLETATKPVS